MIAVCITTYNHAPFIAEAIESVLAQECDEPVRIYVGDDASTDGTETVCRRLAAQDDRIVYIRRPENVGLVRNTIDLYRRIQADGAEYIAMLDGDDYWCDVHKLQIEADYLRTHPEVGLVHTAEQGQSAEPIPQGDLSTRYDLWGAQHSNCTVLFRTEYFALGTDKSFRYIQFHLYCPIRLNLQCILFQRDVKGRIVFKALSQFFGNTGGQLRQIQRNAHQLNIENKGHVSKTVH